MSSKKPTCLQDLFNIKHYTLIVKDYNDNIICKSIDEFKLKEIKDIIGIE